MHDCCEAKADEIAALRKDYGLVLKIVFAINLTMFFAEFGGGLLAHSTALLADSFDMFGDATVYGVSLYVLHKGARWQAKAAFLKGCIMAGFGVAVLAEVAHKVTIGMVPAVSLMSMIGLLALLANTACAIMLLRFRTGEIDMRSTWVCSRNDVIANLGVVLAALGVTATGAAWPDILVGTLIATIFFYSSFGVLRDSLRQLFWRGAEAS
jgi:cation diffusion facilitator family transporter